MMDALQQLEFTGRGYALGVLACLGVSLLIGVAWLWGVRPEETEERADTEKRG